MDKLPEAQGTPQTTEQTPHSGVEGYEKPEQEYATSLAEEAARGDYKQTPDTVPAYLSTEAYSQPAEASVAPLTESGEGDPKKPNRLILGITAGAAATALAIGGFLGIKAATEGANNTPPEKDDRDNSQIGGGGTVEEETPAVPAEAQDFVTRNGHLFSDPVATYYAEKTYIESNQGQGLILDEGYVSSYDFESPVFEAGDTSPLGGFNTLVMSPETEVNTASSVELFNEALPAMNRLLNMVAMNPKTENLEVLKHEFSKYSGISNADSDNLVNFFQNITLKYGSNAVYTINPAVTAEQESSTVPQSIFTYDAPAIDAVDEEGKITAFSDQVDFSINVKSFDSQGQANDHTEIAEDVQFSVVQAKEHDPLNTGYVGIGVRNFPQ